MWEPKWWDFLACITAPHFTAKYEDEPRSSIARVVAGRRYVVQRPNHGLAHSLRQAALASHILAALARTESSCERLREMSSWAQRFTTDGNAVRRLQMAAAFQRAGRQGEASSSEDPKRYARYERADAKLFERAAKAPLFSDAQRHRYARAIRWDTHDDPVAKVIHAAHLLDLRRIPHFDADRMQRAAAAALVGQACARAAARLVGNAFEESGRLLLATGDGDLVTGRGLADRFFLLANDPPALARVIAHR